VRSRLAFLGVLAASALIAASSPAAENDAGCAVTDVDYTVVASLLLKDTEFGAGNGVRPLGSGKLRIRFVQPADGSPVQAKLMSYKLDNHLTVNASFGPWKTQVITESTTTVASGCNGATQGSLVNGDLVWKTPVAGYHSDGTLNCSGNVCGKFGSPPPGISPLHETQAFTFKPFRFSPDRATFSMEYTQVARSTSPKHTTYVSLSGREVARTCVAAAPPCP
jgi:hypothetical protein